MSVYHVTRYHGDALSMLSCKHYAAIQSRVMSRQLSHSINFGRSLRLDVVRPLVLILGEESRTLSAKYRALRSLTEKGLSGFGGNLQQVIH